MSHEDQIEALVHDIDAVIVRYRQEFDLPLASVVGVLDLMKFDLMHSNLGDLDEGEEDGG